MIKQQSLKSKIIEVLWELIIAGEIEPNEPLREIHLAEMLKISRTPLREALQQLKWEGIVVSEPRKGFRLAEFSEEDILEIYPLRAELESYALKLSGIPSDETIEELIRINNEMLHSNSPKSVVELDEQWHKLLISNCSNNRLLQMIKILHRQSQRYEYAYMNMHAKTENSVGQHEAIILQLQKGQLDKAVSLFAENNMVGVEALIEWLKSKKN